MIEASEARILAIQANGYFWLSRDILKYVEEQAKFGRYELRYDLLNIKITEEELQTTISQLTNLGYRVEISKQYISSEAHLNCLKVYWN